MTTYYDRATFEKPVEVSGYNIQIDAIGEFRLSDGEIVALYIDTLENPAPLSRAPVLRRKQLDLDAFRALFEPLVGDRIFRATEDDLDEARAEAAWTAGMAAE